MIITPFNFHGATIRTVRVLGSMDPWFVARDVCDVLGIKDVSMATARLDRSERGTSTVGTPGGAQQFTVVNESGLYGLAFTSRKPEATAFRLWVTGEVLPAIRKTGHYAVAAPTPPDTTTPAGMLEMARLFVQNAEALVAAEVRVAELEPAAAAHDALTNARGALLVREAAAVLVMTESHLRRWLIDERMIYSRTAPTCGATVYDRYASHADRFTVTIHPVRHLRGICAHQTLHVTPLGMDLITRRMAKAEAAL